MGEVIPLFNISDLDAAYMPRLKHVNVRVRVRDNHLFIRFISPAQPFAVPPPVWLSTVNVAVNDPKHGYTSRGQLEQAWIDGQDLILMSGPLAPPLAAHLALSKDACLVIMPNSGEPLTTPFVPEK